MPSAALALLLAQLLPNAPSGAAEEFQRLLTEAGAALDRGDLDAAERGFRRAAGLAPDHPLPPLGLCDLEAQRERWAQALSHCREARRLAPQAPLPALQVAQLLAQQRDVEGALAAFEVARGLDPAAPEAWGVPARLLQENGRAAEARALLEQGLEAAPVPELAEELGFSLLAAGDRARAGDVAAKALERWPERSGLKLVLGLALAGQEGRAGLERAATLLGEVVAEGAGDAGPVRLERGRVLLALGRHLEAASELREAARRLPDSPEAHYLLVQALRESGDLEGAQQARQRLVELGVVDDAVGDALVEALERASELALQGQLLSALESVDAVLADHPGLPPALLLRAQLLGSLGREAEALEAARAAREGAPDVAESHYLEGVFLVRSGSLDAGTRALEQALALDPGLGEAHRLLGEVAQATGRHEDAVVELRAAIAAGLGDPALHRLLAASLGRLGRDEEAQAELAEARRLEQR